MALIVSNCGSINTYWLFVCLCHLLKQRRRAGVGVQCLLKLSKTVGEMFKRKRQKCSGRCRAFCLPFCSSLNVTYDIRIIFCHYICDVKTDLFPCGSPNIVSKCCNILKLLGMQMPPRWKPRSLFLNFEIFSCIFYQEILGYGMLQENLLLVKLIL